MNDMNWRRMLTGEDEGGGERGRRGSGENETCLITLEEKFRNESFLFVLIISVTMSWAKEGEGWSKYNTMSFKIKV